MQANLGQAGPWTISKGPVSVGSLPDFPLEILSKDPPGPFGALRDKIPAAVDPLVFPENQDPYLRWDYIGPPEDPVDGRVPLRRTLYPTFPPST